MPTPKKIGPRTQARLLKEQQRAEQKAAEDKIVHQSVGEIVDLPTFVKALELRVDKRKLEKALKMLAEEGFELYNDVTENFVQGVVQSQTHHHIYYLCRIDSLGQYSCCTPPHFVACMGLQGTICKHLLVLVIGLVKAGKLDAKVIDDWVGKAKTRSPKMAKDAHAELYIRYSGAIAGEVDWRPTQTVPEDYYSF